MLPHFLEVGGMAKLVREIGRLVPDAIVRA
jgi:hypothetical protein